MNQCLVTNFMTMDIVDFFKVIDVDHQQTDGASIPARPFELQFQCLHERAIIGDPGQGIGTYLQAELIKFLLQL